MPEAKLCSIDGCGKQVKNRGYCTAHYKRWWRHGDPLAGRTPNGEPARFLTEVAYPYAGDECLRWPYGHNGDGYGQITHGGKHTYVHRKVCEEVHGPAPSDEHETAHSCGNGHLGCITPNHLRWATMSENHADRVIHGTSNRGERCGAAKLTEPEVRTILAMKGSALQREIAERFNVTPSNIGVIHRRKSWVDI
jgi:HNH endonuclease